MGTVPGVLLELTDQRYFATPAGEHSQPLQFAQRIADKSGAYLRWFPAVPGDAAVADGAQNVRLRGLGVFQGMNVAG